MAIDYPDGWIINEASPVDGLEVIEFRPDTDANVKFTVFISLGDYSLAEELDYAYQAARDNETVQKPERITISGEPAFRQYVYHHTAIAAGRTVYEDLSGFDAVVVSEGQCLIKFAASGNTLPWADYKNIFEEMLSTVRFAERGE